MNQFSVDDPLKMLKRFYKFLLVVGLIVPVESWAGERYEFYNGVRQLGMGGAVVATVNDETALLSNPAALGKLRDYYLTVADPEVDLGSRTTSVMGFGVQDLADPQKTLNKAIAKPDQHVHGRAQIFPSIVVPNFGVGLLGKVTVDSRLDSTSNTFLYDYTSDYALVLGLNFRFWNGIIKLGSNARITNRTEVRESNLDPTRTDLALNTLASSGIGVGSDTGLILTAPIRYLPSIAAVYRDVGRTSYTLRDGLTLKTTNDPTSVPGTIDGAIAIHPILGKRTRMTWTAELRDVQNVNKEKDIVRRAHSGVELNFADAFFLRGGMNQRYWTAGLEISVGNYQFQAASYGEDIGADEMPVEDRRYVAKFAIRF